MKQNYIITLSIQEESDIKALQKAAKVANAVQEIAYLKNGVRNLGFFTKDGDYGAPISYKL